MSNILSQEEIDALLKDDNLDEELDKEDNKDKYLEVFRVVHNKMAKNLSSHMSSIIKSDVNISLFEVTQMTYGDFVSNLLNPTSFNVFSLKPFDGSGILEINSSIVFPMIDKLLGGDGKPYRNKREFSNIEFGLLKMVLEYVMQNLKKSWEGILDINPSIFLQDSLPLKIAQNDENMIVVSMKINTRYNNGVINICYPLLESILAKIEDSNIENTEIIDDVNISLIVGDAKLSMKEIISLKANDLITLQRIDKNLFIIDVDGKDEYIGEIIPDGKKIKLKEKITSTEDEPFGIKIKARIGQKIISPKYLNLGNCLEFDYLPSIDILLENKIIARGELIDDSNLKITQIWNN